MIDLNIYPLVVENYKKYKKLFNENIEYDGYVFNKTKRSGEEKEKLLGIYHEELAKAIFDVFIKLNPALIEQRTGKKVKFVDVYGKVFDILTESMKIQLVAYTSLGSVCYPVNDDIKNVRGDIIKKELSDMVLGHEPEIWRDGKVVDAGFFNGIPADISKKWTGEQRVIQGRKWRSMTDSEKKKWMKNEEWKSLIK